MKNILIVAALTVMLIPMSYGQDQSGASGVSQKKTKSQENKGKNRDSYFQEERAIRDAKESYWLEESAIDSAVANESKSYMAGYLEKQELLDKYIAKGVAVVFFKTEKNKLETELSGRVDGLLRKSEEVKRRYVR